MSKNTASDESQLLRRVSIQSGVVYAIAGVAHYFGFNFASVVLFGFSIYWYCGRTSEIRDEAISKRIEKIEDRLNGSFPDIGLEKRLEWAEQELQQLDQKVHSLTRHT